MNAKACNKCNEIKDLSEFYKAYKTRDGLSKKCKVCYREISKEYHRKKFSTLEARAERSFKRYIKMKKLNSIVAMLFIANTAFGQWVSKVIDNGLDPSYRIAYCENKEETALLKLEQTSTGIAFYLSGGYHCDESPTVDLGLMVDGAYQKYSFLGMTSSDKKTVFIVLNILDEDQRQFLSDFKSASSMVMRINETNCSDDYYKFNMTGSSVAVKFMSVGLN